MEEKHLKAFSRNYEPLFNSAYSHNTKAIAV